MIYFLNNRCASLLWHWPKLEFKHVSIQLFHVTCIAIFLCKDCHFFMEGRAAGHSFESGPSKDIPANLLFLSTRISEKKWFQNNFRQKVNSRQNYKILQEILEYVVHCNILTTKMWLIPITKVYVMTISRKFYIFCNGWLKARLLDTDLKEDHANTILMKFGLMW